MEFEKTDEGMNKKRVEFLTVRSDGALLTSNFPSEINSKMLAVMTAAIIKSSVISSRELKIGNFSYTLLKASKGLYLCSEISPGIILACLFEKKVSLKQALNTIQNLKKSLFKEKKQI